MDVFVSRKRQRLDSSEVAIKKPPAGGDEDTDTKLAILASLHPARTNDDLLEILLSCDGSVDTATAVLASGSPDFPSPKKRVIGMQRALAFSTQDLSATSRRLLTKKGKTLHLYSPQDIASHTPCSIIHNFLPKDLADSLLHELLPEAISFPRATFKLFEKVVQSPHSACFYVENIIERERQKTEYLYNGSNLDDIRELLPVMREVKGKVKDAVNREIETRIRDFYPDGEKLKFQSPQEWQPNAAFVNCYDGAAESVGYHSDQLSYLGPRAVIGSLSLGVAREFRVRKIVAKEEDDRGEAADASGQISIHLPHNSLLVMHAEMQEEWKHSIAPAQSIDPHPIAGNKRINITYRWYRESFHPKFTPSCKCGLATVLKCVQRQKQNRGRYMWMCQAGGIPGGGEGCGFFEWAEFTEDGEPLWKNSKTQVKPEIGNDKEGGLEESRLLEDPEERLVDGGEIKD